jgi:hypothetical protein
MNHTQAADAPVLISELKGERRMRAIKTMSLLLVLLLVASVTPVAAQEPEEIEFTGQVVSVDEDAGTMVVEVEDEGGNIVIYTVLLPEEFDWESIAEGDTVEVEGTLDEDGNVAATKVVNETEEEEEEEEEEEGEGPYFCRPDAAFQHPVGERIATGYGVEYEQVMEWKCGGHGFGQIVHALQAAATSEEAVELLGRRSAGEGWGQIWKDLGLIGRPDNDETTDGGDINGNGNGQGNGNGNGRGNGNNNGRGNGNGNGRGNGPPDHSNAGGRNK